MVATPPQGWLQLFHFFHIKGAESVCTVDLAFYALFEFYAFPKISNLHVLNAWRGFNSRRLHHLLY
jgi:hypothetical protein